MRKATPSYRWIARWIAAHVAQGGWAGPVTVRALLPRATVLYVAGCTPAAAGIATADHYRLYGAVECLAEAACA